MEEFLFTLPSQSNKRKQTIVCYIVIFNQIIRHQYMVRKSLFNLHRWIPAFFWLPQLPVIPSFNKQNNCGPERCPHLNQQWLWVKRGWLLLPCYRWMLHWNKWLLPCYWWLHRRSPRKFFPWLWSSPFHLHLGALKEYKWFQLLGYQKNINLLIQYCYSLTRKTSNLANWQPKNPNIYWQWFQVLQTKVRENWIK